MSTDKELIAELAAALRGILPYAQHVHVGDLKAYMVAITRAHAALAKADPAPITIDPKVTLS